MHNLDSSTHPRRHPPTAILMGVLAQVLTATNDFSWCYCMAPHDEDTKAPTVGNLFCNSFQYFSFYFFFRLPSSCFNFLLVYQIGKFHFTWHHFHIHIISRCCSHVIDTHFLFALMCSLPFRTLLSQLKFFAKSFFLLFIVHNLLCYIFIFGHKC